MVSNFEFLEKDFPVLANFGELAEKYCYSDSNSCLMKLGIPDAADQDMTKKPLLGMLYDRSSFP